MLDGGKDQQVPGEEEEPIDQEMDYSMDEVIVRVYVNKKNCKRLNKIAINISFTYKTIVESD